MTNTVKRLVSSLFAMVVLSLLSYVNAYAQTSSLIIDESTFRPIQQDAMSGLNIDPIGKDRSNRACARLKIHMTRMSANDIAGIDVRPVGGNIIVMKRAVAAEGNGLIIELTARPGTRFYLHHDELGESQVVTVDLEGNREYYIEATCQMYQTITVACDRIGAGVFIDGRFKGEIGPQRILTIPEVPTGIHYLNVADAHDDAGMEINVSRNNVYFSVVIQDSASLQQFVVFQVQPSDATVELDGSVLSVADGVASKMMRFGTYSYKVYAPGYYTEEGTVTVNSLDNRSEVNVKLRSAFGWLEIADNPTITGADVYVDNDYFGKAPLKTNELSSGSHKLKIVKPMYAPYEQYVTLYDGKTLTISPVLDADFAEVTLRTMSSAEIWVNGEYKGIGTWSGQLPSGSYRFESRLKGYRTSVLSSDIKASAQRQLIDIPAPEAVYGKLVIESTPGMATVEIAGVGTKQTPVIISQMLVGTHEVRIRKEGYKDYVANVTITEGQTTTLNATLQKGVTPAASASSSKKASDYMAAAERGDAVAQAELGYCYYYGLGVTVNYYEAVKWYRKAAAQNNAMALNNLGYCYEKGKGVTKDEYESTKWYRKAAEAGSVVAQCNMGNCYENGRGVSKDLGEAFRWYKKAADNGNQRAMNAMARFYRYGYSVSKDMDMALIWYRKAADAGYDVSQNALGCIYYNGEDGVTRNYALAYKYFIAAAQQGNEHAQFNTGLCYEFGNGVSQNMTEARKWYKKAADQGNKRAQEKL